MRFPALRSTCILSMLSLIHCIPVHQHDRKNVKLQAKTIIVRIREHIDGQNLLPTLIIGDPGHYPEIPADKPIQGLGSIMETINTFHKVLQKLPNKHVDQIRRDLSTLLGYLEGMDCTLKESTNGKALDAFLEDSASYPFTLEYMTLNRLKQFMQKLIDNLDQLKIC
ncbi:leptin a isoform X1 [Danio rerio]|uniref:Leptin n=2 Tax=Danio rerio TaxID=7955 RepID=Q0D250_DANRE|nr:leptin a precursor [Danio rerio]XP_009291735.1 leptin isoform X1 [Danio rerio]CAP47064.1 leptin-a [Danio rerio]CAJ33891.1 TPA: putative leptin [Danio rerio]|eukprot:NP_001122048.1 leptin precursor [Danio rerio]